MRLFIALTLEPEEKKRLYDAAEPLRDADFPVRWVEKEAMHLTLKFLGEVHPRRVEEITDAMAEVAVKAVPSDVPLGGFGAFPTIRRPQVIWAGADAIPELRSLKHDLEWELASLGFERELRAFQPHITLGRAEKGSRAGDFRGLETMLADIDYDGMLEAREVKLMTRKRTADGSPYKVVESAVVGPSDDDEDAAD